MQPAGLRAVLFDFDGTLADSYAAITASVNHVRTLHGLPPLDEAGVRCHVGRALRHLLEHTVPGADPDKEVARYREHYLSVMKEGTRLLPGVAEALRQLHAVGLRLAVCSNKSVAFTRDLLRHFDLAPLFSVVLGPEDVARPKPFPDMLQTALARLNVAPAEALYVGDMVVDIETARLAGLAVWVLPTGSDDRESLVAAKPDLLLTDFHELADRLLG